MSDIINEEMCMHSYELDNFSTFVYYFMRLRSLATTMFKWENLPDTVNPIFLEQSLLLYGLVGFAKDDVLGDLIALPAVMNGKLNIYGYPNNWRLFGMNGYNLPVDEKNSVIVWDNYNRSPIFRDLLMFAKRLATIERTIDVNVEGQKTPYILSGDKTQINTLKQIYKDISSNKPVVITDKSLNLQQITCTPTVTPFVAGELQIIKRNIWNEAMTFLGVDNANSEKRERLVTDEAQGNRGAVFNHRYARLKPRQEGAELINKMFGTDITVRINSDWEKEVEYGYDFTVSETESELSDEQFSV